MLPLYSQYGQQQPTQPPSYESVYGRVQAAKENSGSKVGFVVSVIGIVLGALSCSLCLGFLLLYPIITIVIGFVYKNDCPFEPWIPVHLIVSGICGLISNRLAKSKIADISNCFLTVWFVAGNVWVYRTMGNWSDDSEAYNYCHPFVFYFAFWNITSVYIIIVGVITVVIGSIILLAMFDK
ncbi:Hypothetical predicted protein [Mytilus galloprovincialis]|nr:Hypothetical predicted protein [Mytilus galloprovincialis]